MIALPIFVYLITYLDDKRQPHVQRCTTEKKVAEFIDIIGRNNLVSVITQRTPLTLLVHSTPFPQL